jgi:hypothetical protein
MATYSNVLHELWTADVYKIWLVNLAYFQDDVMLPAVLGVFHTLQHRSCTSFSSRLDTAKPAIKIAR